MDSKKIKKLLILNIPYFIVGLIATNFGEAWRMAEGADSSAKILSLFSTLPAAFGNPLPSLHPFDLLIGIACGAILRLAVYLRGKNAKKYRHNVEYGSARWGTAKDIEPFMAPKFEDNIILTKTERLMMSNRPKNPANARNKNVLIVGGSGSGKSCIEYELVNQELLKYAKNNKNCYFVTGEKLYANPDGIHINAESQRRFGIRYFEAYQKKSNIYYPLEDEVETVAVCCKKEHSIAEKRYIALEQFTLGKITLDEVMKFLK